MTEIYKEILKTEYKNKTLFKHIKDKSLTLSRAFEGKKYKNSKYRFMIIGRAMNGWEDETISLSKTPDEVIEKTFMNQFDFNDVIKGKLSCGYNYSRSNFWKLIKYLLEEYDEEYQNWNEKIVWSNLYKVSPFSAGNPTWKLMSLTIDKHIAILKSEIEMYNPDRILLITDNNYLETNEDRPSFIKAFNIRKQSGEYVVGVGEYNGKKIIVCRRPDRRGVSNEHIRKMVQSIKSEFGDN